MLLSQEHCALLLDLIEKNLKTASLSPDSVRKLQQCEEALKKEKSYQTEKMWCQEKLPFVRRHQRNVP